MKITLLEIHDYKCLRDIIIEPGERSLICVGGKNANGKSSLLGAMSTALGGKKEAADEPVRTGKKKATIRVVFDDGEMIVRRKFTAAGASTLEVTTPEGVVKAPQKVLDAMVGKRFIDPMRFCRLLPKEQRETLLSVVDVGIDLEANRAESEAAYVARRDVNRDIKKIEPVASMVVPAMEEGADVESAEKVWQKTQATLSEALGAQTTMEYQKRMVEEAQKQFTAARDRLKAAKESLANVAAKTVELPPLEQARSEAEEAVAQLESAREKRGAVAESEAKRKQKAAANLELGRLERESEQLTEKIEQLAEARSEALAQASIPVDGMTIAEEGLALHGLPFSQASGAERLRAAVAIAWAAASNLEDIWIEDGALLDEDSIKSLADFAEEKGLRVWVERVGEDDKGAIIMREGEVVAG